MRYRLLILFLFIFAIGLNAKKQRDLEIQDLVENILPKTAYNTQYADIKDIDNFISEHHLSKQHLSQLLALRQICYYRQKHYNYNVDSMLCYCNRISPTNEVWQKGYMVLFDTYSNVHKYREALSVAKSIESYHDTLPENIYASIADIYEKLGESQQAIAYYWKALQESERLYTSYNFTSSLYAEDIIRIGEEQHIPIKKEMFACCDSILKSKTTYSGNDIWSPYLLSNPIFGSKTKEDTIAYLSNKAYYSQQVQIEMAKTVLQETMKDKVRYGSILKSNPIDLAQHIAGVYTQIGQPNSALHYYQLADSMAQQIYNSQKRIKILINLANSQIQNGECVEAQNTLQRVQSILQTNWGMTDANLVEYQKRTLYGDLQGFGGLPISYINNYLLISSRLYGTIKEYEKYEQYQSLLQELADLSNKTLRKYLGYYSNYYRQNTDAYVYYNQQNDQFISILSETLTDFQNNYIQYLTKLYKSALGFSTAYSSAEREQIMRIYSVVGSNIIIYAAHTHNQHIAELAYNYALFNKQLLLNTDLQILTAQSDSAHSLINHRNRLIKQQLHATLWGRDSLQSQISQAERLLMALRHDSTMLDSIAVPTMQQIRTAIPDNTACIEFVRYKDFIDWQTTGHTYYAALLLRTNDTLPMFIDLCEESDLQSVNVYNDSIDAYYNSNLIYEHIWAKIMPYLSDIHNIYFSPDGILYQLAIEVGRLPDNQLMSDKFNLIRLTSTKDILTLRQHSQYTSATLFGDIDYGTIQNNVFSTTRTARNMLDPLTYSKPELQFVSKELQKHNITPLIFSQTHGTEEQVMQISGESPSILHFSTHGFTYTNEDALQLPYFSQSQAYYIDPMQRSGLFLSRAALSLSGSNIDKDQEDGILTAAEIATLDLSETDLVVLSACETALGDITSEGVWGMQRAFRMAGARTLVMSLWQVDDEATALLMRYFYEELLTRTQVDTLHCLQDTGSMGSTSAALARAQHRLRQIPKYSSPYYWAGFIAIE